MKEIKFFIVEDDPIFIHLFSNLLYKIEKEYDGDIKINLKTFYSVKEASFELTQKPDVVLLDYYLTDDNFNPITSEKLLTEIKTSLDDTKVIVITGEESPEIIDDLKNKGASFYISKNPKTLHRLIPVLKMLINKKSDK